MKFFNKKKENQTKIEFVNAENMRQISESNRVILNKEEVALLQRERIMYLISLKAEEGYTDLYYSCSDGTADYIDYVDEGIIEELRSKGYKAEYDDTLNNTLYISW